jgi:hypothetical protein
VAYGLISSVPSLEPFDLLYRFLHRSSFNEDGTLNSGAFSLRADPQASVGIAKLIPQSSLEDFCSLKPGQGLAQIKVEDVTRCNMGVTPERDEEWGAFADAHAILTGYASWPNNR